MYLDPHVLFAIDSFHVRPHVMRLLTITLKE